MSRNLLAGLLTRRQGHRQHLGKLDDPDNGVVVDVQCGEDGRYTHNRDYDVRAPPAPLIRNATVGVALAFCVSLPPLPALSPQSSKRPRSFLTGVFYTIFSFVHVSQELMLHSKFGAAPGGGGASSFRFWETLAAGVDARRGDLSSVPRD